MKEASHTERLRRSGVEWQDALTELRAAELALVESPPGIARQPRFDRVLASRRRCTRVINECLADLLDLGRPAVPARVVLSLDVDGVLETEADGFSATGLAGVAALRLLELGGVLVLLNTARSEEAVRERATQLRLLGGVASVGACIWNRTFGQTQGLLSARGEEQLKRLRIILLAEPSIVLDRAHRHSIRASSIVDGVPAPISGLIARQLLDDHNLDHLSFLVAPDHTDFIDRSTDKASGISQLRAVLGVGSLPLAAMGDSVCDVPMLRAAAVALIPAGTLPSYQAPRRQRLIRSRYLGDEALWDAACQLVPAGALRRRVLARVDELVRPEWFPPALWRRPPGTWLQPRLAAAIASVPSFINSSTFRRL